MWTPFVGRGGMGRGAGGGGKISTVQRAIRGRGVQDRYSHSTTSTTSPTRRHTCNRGKKPSDVLSLSSPTTSSSFPSQNLPVYFPAGSEGFEWELVDGSECKKGLSFYDDLLSGPAPSDEEVQFAVSALQQALNQAASSESIEDGDAYDLDEDVTDEIETTSSAVLVKRVSSVGTELDWIEPSVRLCSPRMLQAYGSNRVYDAFHLLQTDPCVQRMVVSLSSDKAVWDAVLKNEVVRELRDSLREADNNVPTNPDEDGSHRSDAATNILSWIFDNTKARVMELIGKITGLVNVLFQPPEIEKTTFDTDPFQEKLRASLMLSIVVLLIVVTVRAV